MNLTTTLWHVTRVAALTAGVLSVAATAARGQQNGTDLRPVDPTQNPPSLAERARASEASIPLAVQRSINGDSELAPYEIKVAGGRVRNITLSGTVPTERLRDRAGRLALETSGTQHVYNDIVVTPHPNDRRGDDASTSDKSDPERLMPERE